MGNNILNIKINAPPLSANILSRPHIINQLEKDLTIPEGFSHNLTIISAPAGFGKTTVARQWLNEQKSKSAWFSLDEGDNEPERFWLYLVSSLQTIHSHLGKGTLEILNTSTLSTKSLSESEAFLTPLLNDLFDVKEPLFLVLDDYHLIENSHIHEAMIYFIENLPPTLHLVVTTRSEPPWPIFKWRAKNKLLEIRQKHLQFSLKETKYLLTNIKGFNLTEDQLANLHDKTEGWVTGLQLAAYNLAVSPNSDDFFKSFIETHQHLFHFLSEEVFIRQSKSVQEFLLYTSVLNRFCPALCNYVTDRKDSSELLAFLERNQLFVVPLDTQRDWYSYHPLFAELLLYYLKKNAPEQVAILHEKAAQWYFAGGELGEAVRHYLNSENLEKVAAILDENIKNIDQIMTREGPRLLIDSLNSLPADLLKKYPRLAVNLAMFQLAYRGKETAKTYISLVEDLDDEDLTEQKEFMGMLAAVKAYYFIYTNDFPKALENGEIALRELPSSSIFWKSNLAIISGDARLFSGNPKGAYPYYSKGHYNNQKNGGTYLSLTTGFKVATTLYYLGQLTKAQELTQELLETAKNKGFSRVARVGLLWTLLGEILRERGDLQEAEHCIERGLFISEPEKPSLAWNYLFKIALSVSQEKYFQAQECINEIENLHQDVALPSFIVFPAKEWKARVLMKQGELSCAKSVLTQIGAIENCEDREVQGGLESSYLILARILLLENSPKLSLIKKLLNKIEELTTEGGNQKLLIETLLTKADYMGLSENPQKATSYLTKALKIGESSGYYQIFKDEGKQLTFDIDKKVNKKYDVNERNHDHLIEDLTSRERDILELLSKGLSNQEISQKLILSVGTIKWHTSNIYGKLGVRNRTQAVTVARELKMKLLRSE